MKEKLDILIELMDNTSYHDYCIAELVARIASLQ